MTGASASSTPTPCAARREPDPESDRRLRDHLEARGECRVDFFLPKDDDEMNNALAAGRYKRAAFANLNALLEAIWKGEAQLDEWKSAGVEIILACPPTSDADVWRNMVMDTFLSLKKWRTAKRRRQIVAGAILSVIALAAMAVLLSFVPPVR